MREGKRERERECVCVYMCRRERSTEGESVRQRQKESARARACMRESGVLTCVDILAIEGKALNKCVAEAFFMVRRYYNSVRYI